MANDFRASPWSHAQHFSFCSYKHTENNSLRVLLEKTKLITKQTRDVFMYVSRHLSSNLTSADFLIQHVKKPQTISQNVYLNLMN